MQYAFGVIFFLFCARMKCKREWQYICKSLFLRGGGGWNICKVNVYSTQIVCLDFCKVLSLVNVLFSY